MVAASVAVGLDHFSPEVEIELSLVRWGGVLGGLIHLRVGDFFVSVVATCVVVLGDFAREVKLEIPLVRWGGFLGWA